MRTSTLALVASALVVASCGQQSMSGVDAFRTVAEALQAGRSAEAAVIPAKAPLIEIKYVDYNGPDYCSENGIKARLNQLGWEASRRLIDIYGSEATAVGRYAAAQSDFDARLDDSDGFVSTICEFDTNAALAQERERAPVALALKTALTPMEAAARAEVGTGDFDAALESARKASTERGQEESAARCAQIKAEAAKPSYDTSPLVKRAQDLLLQNCRNAGYSPVRSPSRRSPRPPYGSPGANPPRSRRGGHRVGQQGEPGAGR